MSIPRFYRTNSAVVEVLQGSHYVTLTRDRIAGVTYSRTLGIVVMFSTAGEILLDCSAAEIKEVESLLLTLQSERDRNVRRLQKERRDRNGGASTLFSQ